MLTVAFLLLLVTFALYVLAKARAYRAWELLDMELGERLAARYRPVGQLVAVHSMPPSAGWAPGLDHLAGQVVSVLARTAQEARAVVARARRAKELAQLLAVGVPGYAA